MALRRSGYREVMRLHDRLDAARHTVDHLAHDTFSHLSLDKLPLDKLPLDKLPLDQLRSVPEQLRTVPEHLAGRLPDELPRRIRRRLPRRMRGALPRRRRAISGRWVLVMAVVLAVAAVMTLRRLAERVEGALAQRDARTPDSGPTPAPAGRVPATGPAADVADDTDIADAPLLDA